jgi:hypothetical protein
MASHLKTRIGVISLRKIGYLTTTRKSRLMLMSAAVQNDEVHIDEAHIDLEAHIDEAQIERIPKRYVYSGLFHCNVKQGEGTEWTTAGEIFFWTDLQPTVGMDMDR